MATTGISLISDAKKGLGIMKKGVELEPLFADEKA